MSSIELLICGIFIVLALILGSGGYFVRKRIVGNCTEQVMANVVDLDWTKGFNGPRISFSIYEFDYKGEHYQVRAKTSSGKRKRSLHMQNLNSSL